MNTSGASYQPTVPRPPIITSDNPPTYDGRTNMEYAPPGTVVWTREASARLRRIHEDYATLERWATEQGADNFFAEQVALDAKARLAEWDEPVERWEP